jgi:iron complex outermembrane receptor protein
VDVHNAFGTFASPRVSVLLRRGDWSSRTSVGSGFFAPGAMSEDTEAAGLRRLNVPRPLRAETGRSVSIDVTRAHGPLTVTGTAFRYDVNDPAIVERSAYVLENLSAATRNAGAELLATIRRAPYSLTGTYAFVASEEGEAAQRGEIPLTPRHSAGLVGMWEKGSAGRIGLELYLTGRQRLEDNPYRTDSTAFVLFGALVERRVGRARVFVNAENLGDVRQSRWQPLVRPSAAADGRWTVDAWAPLDGRVVNAGVRVTF